MGFKIAKTQLYEKWYKVLSSKTKAKIEQRLARIEEKSHFGNTKYLGDGLAEIKFNDGIRIYFIRSGEAKITLILGGFKNGQKKDIQKAKSFLA